MLYIEIIWFSSLQHILEKIMLCCNISIHWDILNSTHTVDLAKTLDILYNLEFNHMEAKITDSKIFKTSSFTVIPLACHLEALGIDSRFAKTSSFTVIPLACHLEALGIDSRFAKTFSYTVLLHVVKKLVLWCVQHIGWNL